MSTLDKFVGQQSQHKDQRHTKGGMTQDLFNQRVTLIRSAAYQQKGTGKKSRLHLELETYQQSVEKISERFGTSNGQKSTLEQKIDLYQNDLPSLDTFHFPHAKTVSPEADSQSVVTLLKDIDRVFIQAYAEHYLSKDHYHQLLDLHRISLNYVLFSYENAQQIMGNRAKENYLDTAIDQINALLKPILHDTQDMQYIGILTNNDLISSLTSSIAEMLFIDIANNQHHASSYTHDRANLISTLDKLKTEFYVDLTRQDGSMPRLEKISRKIEDKVSQQTILSLSRDISLRNNKYNLTENIIPFEEKAYNTIIETLRNDLYKNIPVSESFGVKKGILEQVRDSFESALFSKEFKEILHAEVKEACLKTGDTSQLRTLLYGFGSVEERSFYYLSINEVTNSVIDKFRRVEQNLSRAIHEQDIPTVINLLKRIEITMEKDPSKFGKHGTLFQTFIGLFSKETAYYIHHPDYAKSAQPLEEQFQFEKQHAKPTYQSRLEEKTNEYQTNPQTASFNKRYSSFNQLEDEIRRRASEDYIKEELLSVEPVFKSQEHEEYTKQIQDYMVSLLTSHENIKQELKRDEVALQYTKSILHKIYIQMYTITSETDFDRFFTGFKGAFSIEKDNDGYEDLDYFKSQLLVVDKYLGEEGIYMSKDQLRFYIYRQAKQYWNYLDEEDHQKVDNYFAKRDAAKYKDVLTEGKAA